MPCFYFHLFRLKAAAFNWLLKLKKYLDTFDHFCFLGSFTCPYIDVKTEVNATLKVGETFDVIIMTGSRSQL